MGRFFRRMISLCAVMALLFLCAGCGEAKEYPPYYEKVKGQLGQNVETVIAAMELAPEDFTYEHPFYIYRKPVQYMGYDFNMQLVTNGKGLCFTVMLIMLVEEEPARAAETIVDLRDRMLKMYGSSEVNEYQEDGPQLETVTYDALYSRFADEAATGKDALEWTLEEKANATDNDIYMLFSYAYPVADTEGSAVVIKLVYALETEMERP